MATFTPNTFERPITKIPGLVPARWPYDHPQEASPAPRIEGNEFLRISTPALRPIGPPLPVIAEEGNITSTSSRRPHRVRRTVHAYHVSQPREIFIHPHELQRLQQFLDEITTSNLYPEAKDLESTSQ